LSKLATSCSNLSLIVEGRGVPGHATFNPIANIQASDQDHFTWTSFHNHVDVNIKAKVSSTTC